MKKYLFVAEADRIQDYLFRSAHLREVAGASQLLTRFCREIEASLDLPEGTEKVIADGGKFQFTFADPEGAAGVGQRLAELYRLATDSSLSFAPEAEEFDESGGDPRYSDAVERAERGLRAAKATRPGRVWLPAHGPHWAICESCGQDFASQLTERPSAPGKLRSCDSCSDKTTERDEDPSGFWTDFAARVQRRCGGEVGHEIPWKSRGPGRQSLEPSEVVASFDPFRYVAYLVADGNSMGALFQSCASPDQAKRLSEKLREIALQSLAGPMKLLGKRLEERRFPYRNYLPVYPLIVGGDDVFALLPAPYGIDFAARFCRDYEARLQEFLRRHLPGAEPSGISAAVVICKSKYPYAVAHRRAERLLQEAKTLVKRVTDAPRSSLAFDVIVGNEVGDPRAGAEKTARRAVRTYWVAPGNSEPEAGSGKLSESARAASLEIWELIRSRLDLDSLPQTRRARLRDILRSALATEDPEANRQLERDWAQLMSRVGRNPQLRGDLEAVARRLGFGQNPPRFPRAVWGEESFLCHGLPALLSAWNYSLDLAVPSRRYRGGER